MKFRRGVLFAAIHLAIAIPILVSLEHRDAEYVRDHYVPNARLYDGDPGTDSGKRTDEGEVIVNLDPCRMTFHFEPNQRLLHYVNLPAFLVSAWRYPCPPHWSLAWNFHRNPILALTPANLEVLREEDIGFALLIAIQWLVVGVFPLSPQARLMAQPEWFITFCAVIAGVLVWIRPIAELALFPAVLACFAWFWWCGLLSWRGAQRGFRLVQSRKV